MASDPDADRRSAQTQLYSIALREWGILIPGNGICSLFCALGLPRAWCALRLPGGALRAARKRLKISDVICVPPRGARFARIWRIVAIRSKPRFRGLKKQEEISTTPVRPHWWSAANWFACATCSTTSNPGGRVERSKREGNQRSSRRLPSPPERAEIGFLGAPPSRPRRAKAKTSPAGSGPRVISVSARLMSFSKSPPETGTIIDPAASIQASTASATNSSLLRGGHGFRGLAPHLSDPA
jgi:hypothetical protein